MKFLGLNPKDFYISWPVQSDFFRERVWICALTFPILKALLPKGHEMRFLDGFYEPIRMADYLAAIQWADAVGLNITSSYSTISYAVAVRQIKRLNPKAFVMAGGHHANMYPERWLDLGVDLIVRGEAELMFAQLIDEIAGGRRFERVPGVMFKHDGQFIDTPAPPQIRSLDESPIPDWDMINFKNYINNFNNKSDYTAPIETSRGCVFRCKFCAVPGFWKGTQRYKSVGRVMEELRQLSARGLKQLVILDDGFGNREDYTLELVEAFRRLPDVPRWTSFLRLDSVLKNPAMVDRLAAGGMRMAMVGFEAIDETALDVSLNKGMRRKARIKDLQELYARFRKNNIMINGLFMTGHPGITPDMDTSYRVARTVCDDPHTVNYMPFPGTPGFDDMARTHAIKDMFFHDMKLPIFESGHAVHSNAWLFNLLNLLDVPRALRMAFAPPHYRSNYFLTYRRLLARLARVDRRKIRDFMLLRRKDLSNEAKQNELMRAYLDDRDYQRYIDNLAQEV